MARSGFSSGNFLRTTGSPITVAPFTMSVWGSTAVTGVLQQAFGVQTASNTGYALQKTSGNVAQFTAADGGGGSNATGTTTLPTSGFFHMAGVAASATDRKLFYNGTQEGTNTTSRTPTVLDRVNFGQTSNTNHWQGAIAEAAIWNTDLTAAEVAMLATGLSPLQVRPSALVGYWPLWGTYSPEINLLSNSITATLTGTPTSAAHAPVRYPRKCQ